MKDLAFVDEDDLLEMYFVSKKTFLKEDYAALGVILEAKLPENVKSAAIATLMEHALDRYIAENGEEPFPPFNPFD